MTVPLQVACRGPLVLKGILLLVRKRDEAPNRVAPTRRRTPPVSGMSCRAAKGRIRKIALLSAADQMKQMWEERMLRGSAAAVYWERYPKRIHNGLIYMKHIPHLSSLNSEAFAQRKKMWEVASALYFGVDRGNKHWHNWFIISLKCRMCKCFASSHLLSLKLNVKFSLLWLFLHYWSASSKKCTHIPEISGRGHRFLQNTVSSKR